MPNRVHLESLKVRRCSDFLQTEGMKVYGVPEIRLYTEKAFTEDSVRALFGATLDCDTTQMISQPSRTFKFGYWPMKVRRIEDTLEIWEATNDLMDFCRGASLAIEYWEAQHETCENLKAVFTPPDPNQLAVISDGVLEGDLPVEGIRYPSPPHMSGWWLLTDRYSGNIRELKTVHLHHVTSSVEDAGRLIALPYGYRFQISDSKVNAWYDEKVVQDGS